MSIQMRQVSVLTTATRLDTSSSEIHAVSQCIVRNLGTESIWVGNVSVTIANGFEVMAGEAFTVDLGRNEGLYGIAATVAQPCGVLEAGAA